MRTLFALVLLLGCLAAGCGGGSGTEVGASEPPREVVGLVVAVEPPVGEVESFRLETGLETLTVYPDPSVPYGFDLGHLRFHQRVRAPVRCRLASRGGRLYALSIVDA